MNFTLRQSQALSTFGVGAIVDYNQQSLIPTYLWARSRPEGLGSPIEENYLLNEIKRSYPELVELYPYPEARTDPSVRGMNLSARRFPNWLYCPTCGKLKRYASWLSLFREKFPGEPTEWFSGRPYCPLCRALKKHRVPLMPPRFIVACKHGHLSEFPWVEWCHDDMHSICCDDLRIDTGAGEGISSIRVHCDKCHVSQPLAHAFGRGGLRRIMPFCHGETPWKGAGVRDTIPCKATPMVVQRGGSNIYYPLVQSSISLPAAKQSIREQVLSLDGAGEIIGYFKKKSTPSVAGVLAEPAMEKGPAFEKAWETGIEFAHFDTQCEHHGIDLGKAKLVLQAECLGPTGGVDADNRLAVEFDTFSHEYSEGGSDRSILTVVEQNPNGLEPAVASLIDKANLVTRLRVVSVLTHFTRLLPPNVRNEDEEDGDSVVKQLAFSPKSNWLPAYQGYGEGVFISLNPKEVEHWLKRKSVIREAAEMGLEDPAYVLVHTFSHFLMKALSVCCGYSLTALQEKIYSSQENHQYGLLIYTSAPDVHGTLGGLVRQGQVGELSALIRNAVMDARSCSNDPICSDTAVDPQASSKAACYACAFLPETSCCNFNRYLNRHFLVDNSGDNAGYFNGLI